jgi:serine phosphatase RsbU (regulator of sigma subunit)
MNNMAVKVLIIEDDAFVALLLREFLTKWGYEIVDVISDGEKAIEAFKEHQPNILLVDILLDGPLTGIDVVSEIKKIQDVPVLYITADLDAAIIDKSMHTEPSGYLIKPFDENQLKATIETALASFSKISKTLGQLKEELSMAMMQVEELSETNSHLITATFRERALKQELEATKALIEAQSKKILDSINYSLRIQQSIIPSAEIFSDALGKHCVFYKPKDVVSGDFPWLLKKDRYVYYGAIDCTGHGVPGAMMSMIGNLLLNAIVQNGNECKTPSEVLAELHKAVVQTLKQDAEGNKAADGMDASLCRIDFEKKELLFSGAHLPMLFLRDGELETFKGDKFPVGGMQYRNRNTYSDHRIELKDGDKFFVFSDGIIDQVGGEENMKWMTSRLREFILENQSVPMNDFKELISNKFDDFKGDHKQVDDVLLIGVEI